MKNQTPPRKKPIASASSTQEAPTSPWQITAFTLLCLLLFVAPLVKIEAVSDDSELPKSLLIDFVALLILSLSLAGTPGKIQFPGDRSLYALPVFLAWGAVTLIWSSYLHGAVYQWMHWLCCSSLLLTVPPLLSRERRLHWALFSLCSALFLNSVLGIAQKWAGLDWFSQAAVPGATFNNKNVASDFVVLSLPAAIMLCSMPAPIWMRGFAGMCLLAGYVFIVAATSKAAWLAMIILHVALVVLLIKPILKAVNRTWIKLVLTGLATALVVGVIATATASKGDPHREMVGIFYKSLQTSFMSRSQAWRNSYDMALDHPLGVGIRNFMVYYPLGTDRREVAYESQTEPGEGRFLFAHNDLLQLWVETGVAGLLMLAFLAGFLIQQAIRVLQHRPTLRCGPPITQACALSGFVGLAVLAQFSFPLYCAIPPLILALYASLLVIPLPSVILPLPQVWKQILLISSLALVLLWSRQSWLRLVADYWIHEHNQRFGTEDWAGAIEAGNRVMELAPIEVAEGDFGTSMARALYVSGDKLGANRIGRRLVAVFPHTPAFLQNQMSSEYGLGFLKEAEAHARHLVDLRPGLFPAHLALGEILLNSARPAEALPHLREAVRLNAASTDARLCLARAALEAEDVNLLPEAEAAAKAALAMNEKLADGHRTLGIVLGNQAGRDEEAIFHLKRALELNPRIDNAEEFRKVIEDFETHGP